jgi:hypothetical protein
MSRSGANDARGQAVVSIPLGIAAVITIVLIGYAAVARQSTGGGGGTCVPSPFFWSNSSICATGLCGWGLILEGLVLNGLWIRCRIRCKRKDDFSSEQCAKSCDTFWLLLLAFAWLTTAVLCGSFGGIWTRPLF